MKTLTELRNHVNNIKLLGCQRNQIIQMIDLFEQGLLEECKLNLLGENMNSNFYVIGKIETLNKILK